VDQNAVASEGIGTAALNPVHIDTEQILSRTLLVEYALLRGSSFERRCVRSQRDMMGVRLLPSS
jgi:hypothetical protein